MSRKTSALWTVTQQLEQTAAKESCLQLAVIKALIFPLKLCGIVKNPHLIKQLFNIKGLGGARAAANPLKYKDKKISPTRLKYKYDFRISMIFG